MHGALWQTGINNNSQVLVGVKRSPTLTSCCSGCPALQPWRLELKREVRTAQASAKIRASLRPGAALERPEVLLCGGEDCKGGWELKN